MLMLGREPGTRLLPLHVSCLLVAELLDWPWLHHLQLVGFNPASHCSSSSEISWNLDISLYDSSTLVFYIPAKPKACGWCPVLLQPWDVSGPPWTSTAAPFENLWDSPGEGNTSLSCPIGAGCSEGSLISGTQIFKWVCIVVSWKLRWMGSCSQYTFLVSHISVCLF